MQQTSQEESSESESNLRRNIVLFIVTNKRGDGTQKGSKGKKDEHYSSFLLPASTARLTKDTEERIFVLDIDDPKNKGFWEGEENASIWAFPVDENYRVEAFETYKKGTFGQSKDQPQKIFLKPGTQPGTQQIDPREVSFVIPYVSAEADPVLLRNMSKPFLPDTGMLNDPNSLETCDSKDSLEVTRTDPAAAHIAQYFLPNILIKTPEEYYNLKAQYPEGVVLRDPRGTEGIGVFIKDEIEENGGIEQKLKEYPKGLLLTPFFDTRKTGDTRVYVFVDENNQVTVLPQGIKRIAGPGKYAKCNVSAGGSFEIVELTDKQKEVAAQAGLYYKETYGLHWIGFDFFFTPKGEKPQVIGNQEYPIVISEGNFSPDGLIYIPNGVETVSSLCVGRIRRTEQRQRNNLQVSQQTLLTSQAQIERPKTPEQKLVQALGEIGTQIGERQAKILNPAGSSQNARTGLAAGLN